MSTKKGIAILGSTGSIGTQALEVIDQNPDLFEVSVLTANENATLLIQQALKFNPNSVVIVNEEHYQLVKDALINHGIKVYTGSKSIEQIIELDDTNLVLNALVGFSGLNPTIKALETGKILALANKESLVVAGDYVNDILQHYKGVILPVDSEHSAIFQCLAGEFHNPIEKIILTASGGPFRGKDSHFLKNVTVKDALNHPKWLMGSKITIDSATMINKGFEAIEAKWLFDLSPDQIQIIIHPQSIIHSIVQFTDGSMKAQLSQPDMRLPIQYALTYPSRIPNNFPRLDLLEYNKLTFEPPDYQNFPNLTLAKEAFVKGGNLASILNAANEVSVNAFLNGRIAFNHIYRVNEQCMNKIDYIQKPSSEEYFETDKETRKLALTLI